MLTLISSQQEILKMSRMHSKQEKKNDQIKIISRCYSNPVKRRDRLKD